MDLFQHKRASDSLENINMGASSLRYDEVRAKNQPSVFKANSSLQFEFSSPGRHILLSESWFEVDFQCYKRNKGAAVGTANSYRPIDGEEYTGNGTVNPDKSIDVALQQHFLNLTMDAIRHSINGRQVASTNDPALAKTFQTQQQSAGYDSAAASVQFGHQLTTDRLNQTITGTKHSTAWCPPLGIWSTSTAIPGSALHNLTIDMKSFSSYNASIFEVSAKSIDGTASDKLLSDFIHIEDRGTASTEARQQYYFGITDIRLRLASVSAQDMRMPSADIMIETRECEISKFELDTNTQCNKQVLIPGSVYKTGVCFLGAGHLNDPVKSASKSELREITNLTNLSLHLDGHQYPSPEYVFEPLSATEKSLGTYTRAYIDWLAANGNVWSENLSSGVGCAQSLGQWSERPVYLQRVVSPPGMSKDLLLRAQFAAGGAAKTLVLCAYYTKALVIRFDTSGNVSNVEVSEYA